MRSVNTKFLRPGQVVADTIHNSSGATLCPLGYTLTEKAIERLKNAGIASVWIEGDPDAGPDTAKLQADLDRRFSGRDEPVLMRVKALLQRRIDLIRDEYGG